MTPLEERAFRAGYAASQMDHLNAHTEQMRAEVQNQRILIAQARDDLLTPAEQIAMLNVYSEFGR